ncbi:MULTISPECIES: hypothetical protein [Streptomyces]|uniref:Uncharacterized protein n=1 Tax=Streptomyces ramulosus TaxID=47762 RepID=A0ABW1FGM8_9ACTN
MSASPPRTPTIIIQALIPAVGPGTRFVDTRHSAAAGVPDVEARAAAAI